MDISKIAHIDNELKALENLKYNPNLVNYKKVYMKSAKYLYLIMEYCANGSLDTIIAKGS